VITVSDAIRLEIFGVVSLLFVDSALLRKQTEFRTDVDTRGLVWLR
jgi:hypothetical protein